MKRDDVVVFLGPTLPLARARRVLPARYLPPAREGDVFRVLPSRPRVLVLVDGLFQTVPSVWHHELRAALASGVHVLGASSMGALRAAELQGEGMVPVGRIAREYASGQRSDDADVVLLHGDAESDYLALTVPLVNLEATVEAGQRTGALSAAEARALRRLARRTFFHHRTYAEVVRGLRRPAARRAEVLAWLRGHEVNQKALDALEALRLARALRTAPAPVSKVVPFSSLVRRRRLAEVHGPALAALQALPDAEALARQGLRRLLLASFARQAGLTPPHRPPLDAPGLAADEALADAEVQALEALVLSAPERFVPDGPSWLEGLALEARLAGRWPGR